MNKEDYEFVKKIRKQTLTIIYSFFCFDLVWVAGVVLFGLGLGFYVSNTKNMTYLTMFLLGIIFLLFCVCWYIWVQMSINKINGNLVKLIQIIKSQQTIQELTITKIGWLIKIARISYLTKMFLKEDINLKNRN